MLNNRVKALLRYTKSEEGAMSVINKVQFAELAGVSRQYLYRNSKDITKYLQDAPYATELDIKFVREQNLKHIIDKVSSFNKPMIYNYALGYIYGYLMKYEYGLLKHIYKHQVVINTGVAVVNLVCTIKKKKDSNNGTSIHSSSKDAKYLLNHNKVYFVDTLFNRSDAYYNGHSAKQWKLTEENENMLEKSLHILLANLHRIKQKNSQEFIDKVIDDRCYIKQETYATICLPISVTLFYTKSSIHIFPIESLSKLCLVSTLHILTHTLYLDNGLLYVLFNHSSSTNPSYGRNYNTFCSLRSQERLSLGYISYDMSSALQSICLNLVGTEQFPLLSRYTKDISYKKDIRVTIAKDLNIEVCDVKKKLTAFANGAISEKDKHPFYKQFQKESDLLRKMTLAYVSINDLDVLKRALKQSKKYLAEDIDWLDLGPEDSQTMARNKSSVFFFVWTWYERKIRKAMLSLLPNGLEVHDAVYFKSDIDVEIIEEAILKLTGFNVKIEKELL